MPARKRSTGPRLPVRNQISSGGVVVRRTSTGNEVAIIRPRGTERWQLPKGIVDPGESPDVTAQREVREEAGIDASIVGPITTIEYWYVGDDQGGERVRFHKTVHFFLLVFRSGDVADHDHEVAEARWVPLDGAVAELAFRNEKAVVEKAREMIASVDILAP
jgi:8-oxo-dGTP pyrophosphatase MutT (NUDIX family)